MRSEDVPAEIERPGQPEGGVEDDPFPEDQQFADEGYYCGLVGKLHLASAAGGQEPRVDDGYEYFEYSHDHKGPEARGNDYAKWLRSIWEDPRKLLEKPGARKDYAAGADNPSFGGLRVPTDDRDNITAP
jgi:arylsulfatase A-like enzyme